MSANPDVSVEVDRYRPFFVMGEVTAAGQYPYVHRHDGADGGGDRRRLHAARQRPYGEVTAQRRRPARAHRVPLDLAGPARRHHQRRRAVVLTESAAVDVRADRALLPRAGRRPVPPCSSTSPRAGGKAGHAVGVVCDASTGGGSPTTAARRDSKPASRTRRSVRVRMRRRSGASRSRRRWRHVGARGGRLAPDVLHGHGAKGGAYAPASPLGRRSARRPRLHAARRQPALRRPHARRRLVYLPLERLLARRTDAFVFESAYRPPIRYAARSAAARPRRAWCTTACARRSSSRSRRAPDAADFVFVGELRRLKGVDVLIDALARLRDRRPPASPPSSSATAPDARYFRDRAEALGLSIASASPGPCPRARPSRSAAPGRALAARSCCPMSCWRPPPPACR